MEVEVAGRKFAQLRTLYRDGRMKKKKYEEEEEKKVEVEEEYKILI